MGRLVIAAPGWKLSVPQGGGIRAARDGPGIPREALRFCGLGAKDR